MVRIKKPELLQEYEERANAPPPVPPPPPPPEPKEEIVKKKRIYLYIIQLTKAQIQLKNLVIL